LADAICRVVSGEPRAMSTIATASHEELKQVATSLPRRLVVTRAAAVAVLEGLVERSCAPEEAQAWASFVRRGYVAGVRGPIAPLGIDYEDAWEDAIVEAVGRLDEIGDLIDGEISDAEALLLLQLLGVP
jgi:hypothetical protein